MHLNLGTRFTLLLLIVFLLGTIAGGIALWEVLERRAEAEISTQGLILIETMNSVRRYTSAHIRPLLEEDLVSEPDFISETVPAFSARQVFDGFRANESYENFLYKEASLNPTNPANRADEFEAEILARISARQESDFRMLDGERVFYIARPMDMSSESCLACHGSPQDAPASLLNTYGDQGGFGFELDELMAVQVIYVPAERVITAAWRSFSLVMSLFVLLFAIVILLINWLLHRYVVNPIGTMSSLALKISEDSMTLADLQADDLSRVTRRNDELGRLGRVFRKMASEVFERTHQLRSQLSMLVVEVDDIKRQDQVAELVESDFFKALRERAREIRQADRKSA